MKKAGKRVIPGFGLSMGVTLAIVSCIVLIPPALFTGAGLAFGRCLGEYGSVVFIAGNKPYYTEITPLIM